MKRKLSFILSGVLILAFSSYVYGKTEKVTICHYDGKGRIHKISISESAVDKHISQHGDHTLITYYKDADGDGFGQSSSTVEGCVLPDGYTETGGDCDDENYMIHPEAEDICDAVDNNCDGIVDNGSGDWDNDGISDCLDDDCDLEEILPSSVPIDKTCQVPREVIEDPWNIQVEWQWGQTGTDSPCRGSSCKTGSFRTPFIGNLNDDNGDGVIDTDDTPDVVITMESGTIVALDGATGTELWSRSGNARGSGIAVADADGDGITDIVALDSGYKPILLSNTGELKWTCPTRMWMGWYPTLTVTDVEGDGQPEILAGNYLINGADGTLLTVFDYSNIQYWAPTTADIDQDGIQEIFIFNHVYSPDGTLLWTSPARGTKGHWVGIADVDGDPSAEVIQVGGGSIVVHDEDGTVLSDVSSTSAENTGPMCVSDFDGDGEVEMAWANETTMAVYELDGTENWSVPIDEFASQNSCSAYDFDQDGIAEILYADHETFRIFDGATGAVRYSNSEHHSVTITEYPTVADIDKDGSAEIVVVSNNAHSPMSMVTVFGHTDSAWVHAPQTWGIHDFAVTNLNQDGTVPAPAAPWWQTYNMYRGYSSVELATDLRVEIADVCASGCGESNRVRVVVQVSNHGGAEVQAGIPVSLYANNGGSQTLLDTQTLPTALPGGQKSSGIEFNITVDDYGVDGLWVVVNEEGEAGSVYECNFSNNTGEWMDSMCN